MKKMIILSSVFILFLSSCKKENSTTQQEEISASTFSKVSKWLDSKMQSVYKDTSSANAIINLKENLVQDQMSIETLNKVESLIIIPLKNEFKTINVTNQQSFKSLVIEVEGDVYKQGMIIEIIPKNQTFDKVPVNLVSNIYANRENDLNGIFSMLSLTNNFLHEKEYNNGKLLSIKYLSKKNDESSNGNKSTSQRANSCDDVYLVTYYSDGTTNWQYLYSTCDVACRSLRTIDASTAFKTECGGGGDVGGGNSGSGGNTHNQVPINVSISNEEGDGYFGAPPVRYTHNAQITKDANSGEILYVIVDPTTADPMVSFYTDNQNRSTTRTLTLYGHYNRWTSLGTTALINWDCFVNGLYVYTNSTPSATRVWGHTYSAVQ